MSGLSQGTSLSTDDYVEGTFTPALTGATVVGTPTYTGRYTKIGRLVHYEIIATCDGSNTLASTAGTTFINNLPYTVGTNGSLSITNITAIANLGVGYNKAATAQAYLGTFSAQSQVVYISGWFSV